MEVNDNGKRVKAHLITQLREIADRIEATDDAFVDVFDLKPETAEVAPSEGFRTYARTGWITMNVRWFGGDAPDLLKHRLLFKNDDE